MAKKENKEHVSMTFHYIFRALKGEDGEAIEGPITQQEFDHIYSELQNIQRLDYRDKDDKKTQLDIRMQKIVPITKIEKFDEKYISGLHLKAYSGHEIENIDFGKIPRNSPLLRPFYFMLYLAADGRMFICTQALGNYSGYVALRDTIKSLFKNKRNLIVSSVRSTNYVTKNAIIKEAHLDYSRKSKDIHGKSIIGKKGAVIFKDGDEGFSEEMKTSFLPFLDKDRKEIKKGISQVVKDNTLVAMNDDDLDECRLIVTTLGGGTRTIQFLDKSGWPTHFDTGIETNSITGHPDYEPMKKISLEILEEEVLSNC